MTTREEAPAGAPCWTDIWTSDVEGSRRFYADLFGWKAEEPNAEFGGYFMFTRRGVPVAGGMGSMPDAPARDIWTVFLNTPDIATLADKAVAEGAELSFDPVPVADLGVQTVLTDPSGARVGAWQAGTFPGFTVLNEHGAPSWFELHARGYESALAFYRSVFGWETNVVEDSDQFRYTTAREPGRDVDLAGVCDDAANLPASVPSHWQLYWEVDDVDDALRRATTLGGSVVTGAGDTPYGRLAALRDPSGAAFNLRRSPA